MNTSHYGIEYAFRKVSRIRGLLRPHALVELRTVGTSTGSGGTEATWLMNAGAIETATACNLVWFCKLQIALAISPFVGYDVP